MTDVADVGVYRLFGAGGSPYSVKANPDDEIPQVVSKMNLTLFFVLGSPN